MLGTGDGAPTVGTATYGRAGRRCPVARHGPAIGRCIGADPAGSGRADRPAPRATRRSFPCEAWGRHSILAHGYRPPESAAAAHPAAGAVRTAPYEALAASAAAAIASPAASSRRRVVRGQRLRPPPDRTGAKWGTSHGGGIGRGGSGSGGGGSRKPGEGGLRGRRGREGPGMWSPPVVCVRNPEPAIGRRSAGDHHRAGISRSPRRAVDDRAPVDNPVTHTSLTAALCPGPSPRGHSRTRSRGRRCRAGPRPSRRGPRAAGRRCRRRP